MNKIIKTLDYLFNILLLTYPKLYREEYGFEVQGVFRQIIHGNRSGGQKKNLLNGEQGRSREPSPMGSHCQLKIVQGIPLLLAAGFDDRQDPLDKTAAGL